MGTLRDCRDGCSDGFQDEGKTVYCLDGLA